MVGLWARLANVDALHWALALEVGAVTMVAYDRRLRDAAAAAGARSARGASKLPRRDDRGGLDMAELVHWAAMKLAGSFVVAGMVAGMAVAAAGSPKGIPAVALSGAWASVKLPATPLGVVEHGGKLWVCGTNEMIAESEDGGRHWTLRHENNGGEMLFALVFPEDSGPDGAGSALVEAFGTRGRRLVSSDGGASWKRQDFIPKVDWTAVVLGGENGFASNFYQFGWTSDGGATWQTRTLVPNPAKPAGVENRSAMGAPAVLDPNDAAIPFSNEKGSGIAATTNGGQSWEVAKFEAAWDMDNLRHGGQGYELYGTHAEKGEAAQPAEATSRDGKAWNLAVGQGAIYSDCNAQGCRIPGGWADLRAGAARLLGLRQDDAQPLHGSWAASGDTVCQVSTELRCRSGHEAWVPQTDPQRNATLAGPSPIHTPDPDFPGGESAKGQQGTVILSAWIGSDGRVQQVLVRDAPAADFARVAAKKVMGWRFRPASLAGVATAVWARIEVNFRLRK